MKNILIMFLFLSGSSTIFANSVEEIFEWDFQNIKIEGLKVDQDGSYKIKEININTRIDKDVKDPTSKEQDDHNSQHQR